MLLRLSQEKKDERGEYAETSHNTEENKFGQVSKRIGTHQVPDYHRCHLTSPENSIERAFVAVVCTVSYVSTFCDPED